MRIAIPRFKSLHVDGGTTNDSSPQSPFLCSIHVNASVGAAADEVDLVWNSPYVISGEGAGGPFYLETTE